MVSPKTINRNKEIIPVGKAEKRLQPDLIRSSGDKIEWFFDRSLKNAILEGGDMENTSEALRLIFENQISRLLT